jgi:SNF family Na+-dependent transporter
MGYAIGIGNVWRFPYLCGKYGGGTFVFVYLFCLVFVAFPLFFLEMVVGQFYQKGPVFCFWKLHPRFRGVAYVAAFADFFMMTYYMVIIAWALHYFAVSFHWRPSADGSHDQVYWFDKDTEEYFYKDVLNQTPKFGDAPDAERNGNPWTIQTNLFVALAGVWTISVLCMVSGLKSMGKVAYFTVIAPFFLIFVLFCKTEVVLRCWKLEGQWNLIGFAIGAKPL